MFCTRMVLAVIVLAVTVNVYAAEQVRVSPEVEKQERQNKRPEQNSVLQIQGTELNVEIGADIEIEAEIDFSNSPS